MADYYDTTAAETVKLWSRKTWRDWRQSDSIFDPKNKFVGDDADRYPVVMLDDFEAGPGDKLTITLSHQIGGRGATGDEELEGKEQVHETDTFDLKVDVLRHAVKCRGKFMNLQRVHHDTVKEASNMLREWFAKRREVMVTNHLCGNSRQTDLAFTGNNTVAEPDTEHIYRINQGLGTSNDQTVGADTSAKFDVDDADALVTLAETADPPLKPFYIDGNPYYGMMLHPFVVEDLRNVNSTWYAEMKAALQGGAIKDNPIWGRALGMHRNVIFFSNPYITQGKNSSTGAAVSNTRRNVFFGAGAVAMGYGIVSKEGDADKLKWFNSTWDFGAKYGVAGTMVTGVKAVRFNDYSGTARDYGKIVVVSYSADRRAYKYKVGNRSVVDTYDYGQPQ